MHIMENSEEVLQILERFTKLKQKDIPKELEDYLSYVAKTGDTVYRWSNVKYLFREKLVHVIKEFHDTTPSVDDLPQYPNVDPFNYETMKSALLERLEMFNAAPFTVQRLCELLTDPRKQYSRIDKFMRALEKNILVVSTVEPGRKQPESENGDSLDSVVNGDLSLDVNVDIDMESESIFSMEPQNSSSTVAIPVASSSSSSSSSSSLYTKSDDIEDSEVSLPKKPKLDIIDDNTEMKITKSDSESESETSDDSDSSDSKETISTKDEIDITSTNKIDDVICNRRNGNDEADTTTITCAVTEKMDDDEEKENQNCEDKLCEKIERTIDECHSTETKAEHDTTTDVIESKTEMKSQKSNIDSENGTADSPSELSQDQIGLEKILEKVESIQKKNEKKSKEDEEEKNEEEGLPLDILSNSSENEESIKPDSTELSCVKESEKSQKSETEKSNEIQEQQQQKQQQSSEYSSNIPSDISSNLNNEDVTQQQQQKSPELTVDDAVAVVAAAAELIQKDNSNIPLIFPESSKTKSVTEQAEAEATVTSELSSDLIEKIPTEQMSVEDQLLSSTTAVAVAAAAATVSSSTSSTSPLLLPQVQECSSSEQQPQQQQQQQAALLTTNGEDNSSSSTTSSSSEAQQQIRDDQPMMDENLDTTDPSTVIDEVMQSNEAEHMSTDTGMKIIDDKIDLSGMDVDDNSLEEAMDQ